MTNVLKPDLVWIEGRCYRVNDPSTEMTAFHEHDLYENEPAYADVEDDEDDDNIEVVRLDNGRFSTLFHVPNQYLGYIIGKKAATKRRLESDTRTEIRIPKQGQNGDVVILGLSAANVKATRRRINTIVMSSRFKQRPTHFISIPMTSPEIIENFNEFKEDVLKELCDRGVEEKIFTRSAKLHLTLGMLCLMDNEERLLASKLLSEARQNIVLPLLQAHHPLRIQMKGVSYMNDDPKEINVLYATVQEIDGPPGLIQQLADEIVGHFSRAGLMERSTSHVKLHVTLLNTSHRNEENAEEWSRSRPKRVTFDGSRILEKYADHVFGVQVVTAMHLSQRHSCGADGYYQPTSVISCVNASDE